MPLETKRGKIIYRCGKCKAAGVKLWREPQRQELYCFACACHDQRPGQSFWFTLDGMVAFETDEKPGDCIGRLIPALMTGDGKYFWAYIFAPNRAIETWAIMPITMNSSAYIK